MAAKGSEMVLALAVVLMMYHGAWAQAGCSNAMMSMAPCLNFVTGNSTKPSSACCSSLAGVVKTQPQCLCTMMNGGGAMTGFSVNQTLAMELPTACNVQTPPASRCNGPAVSAASPKSSPAGSPSSKSTPPADDTPVTTKNPSTSSQTNTPSSSGSKSTPSTDGASSSATSTSSTLHVAIFLPLAVSFALKAIKF